MAGATEKQLQLVVQALKQAQAAKALSDSLAATVAHAAAAQQQQQPQQAAALPPPEQQHREPPQQQHAPHAPPHSQVHPRCCTAQCMQAGRPQGILFLAVLCS